jgi:hypothetical protein
MQDRGEWIWVSSCVVVSAERGQRPYPLQRGDEGLQVGIGGAEAQVQASAVTDQSGRDVEEPQPEPFAAGPPVGLGQDQGA